ncbi:MAG: beta-ketoacyl-[acyl-carrier-protein] synthase family protein [Planctomycetaceae bacterium]|nr:beta-ketoacyl-[acyl-carrier-protein] synthase family protein [Planctomycetales bacterium]MCB9927514.1 beta-ketoacyl-[acyl-carrier-protein] synthase family protein [Planctomycetaceae bacterium]
MPAASNRRVVVTGVGIVSPLGCSRESLWDALRSGRSGVGELELIETRNLPTKYGAEVRDFTGHIDNFGPLDSDRKKAIRKGLKVMCREIQMGVAAAQLAMADAGLEPGGYSHERTGIVYGSDYIMTLPEEFMEGVAQCLDSQGQFEFDRWAEEGLPKVTPLWLLKYLPNMPASHIAIYNDMRGPNNSITLREASANLAVAEAYSTIARGSADAIIAGATGTRVHSLRSIHVVLQEPIASGSDDPAKLSRPFDRDRTGLVLGEGAGAIMLEELETAKARGANILGEVVGYGSSTVTNRLGEPQTAVALRNVLQQSLRTSGLSIDEIGHIHAHGLSTKACDSAEAAAIQQTFVNRASPVPVTAAKSYFGNLGAGSGIVEIIASLLAIQEGELFPILNYEHADSECPIHAARGDSSPGNSFINVNISPQGQAGAIAVRAFA